MDRDQKRLLVLFFLVLAILISLGCNFPIAFDRLFNIDDESAKHTVVAEFDATLVSEEGEPIKLYIANGMEWICRDVQGELSSLAVGEIPDFDYHEAEIEWKIQYREYDKYDGFNVFYTKFIDRDYSVIEVDGSKTWFNEKWSGDSKLNRAEDEYIARGVYKGVLSLEVSYQDTSPQHDPYKKTETHHYYFLVDLDGINMAYLCDQSHNPITQDLSNLTPGNFQQSCSFWYYECPLKK